MNVILYCRQWGEAVAFYRDKLGFPTKLATFWLVEFEVAPNTYLSVADAKRTSIQPSDGAGITVTFKVADVRGVWQDLLGKDVKVEPIRDNHLGGQAFFLRDPDGNRLEFWSEKRLSQEVVFSIPM
jgi:catechol 2,3-dioxygenase-like lactoylglutathione lyase family enzyme